MIIIHFEVYVLESRGWMLHARFPRQERDEALSEAKEIESSLSLQVKVLRETYNTDTNHFEELQVYRTAQGKVAGHGGPAAGSIRGGGAGASRMVRSGRGGASHAAAKPMSTAAATAVLMRLSVILLVAVGLGLGALRLVPQIILLLYDYGFRVTSETYSEILMGVFLLVVLMVAVPLGLRFLPSHATIGGGRARGGKRPASAPPVDPRVKSSLDALARKASLPEIAIPETWGDDPPAADPEPPPPESPPPEPDPIDLPDSEPPEWGEADPGDLGQVSPASSEEIAARAQCDRFLDGALRTVSSVVPVLDQYNRFALNLYMAGAVEALAESRRLDAGSRQRVLQAALERLGAAPEIAARFYDKMAEYMMEPRYMRLIQAGRSGMEALAAGAEAEAHSALAQTLKEWNKPAAAAERSKPSIMTVMFTDMVGSTDMTQARGDVGAQEIVRRHNSIVRGCLAAHGGREVKHTGDGIMASFGSAAGAVLASVEIQRQVAAHNQRQPGQPLHLRIGLNAGEPIQEEDDLFGTTVQLAARVCAATQPDQILCTTVVKDLASGKTVAFAQAGTQALKGFRDKVALWEALWR